MKPSNDVTASEKEVLPTWKESIQKNLSTQIPSKNFKEYSKHSEADLTNKASNVNSILTKNSTGYYSITRPSSEEKLKKVYNYPSTQTSQTTLRESMRGYNTYKEDQESQQLSYRPLAAESSNLLSINQPNEVSKGKVKNSFAVSLRSNNSNKAIKYTPPKRISVRSDKPRPSGAKRVSGFTRESIASDGTRYKSTNLSTVLESEPSWRKSTNASSLISRDSIPNNPRKSQDNRNSYRSSRISKDLQSIKNAQNPSLRGESISSKRNNVNSITYKHIYPESSKQKSIDKTRKRSTAASITTKGFSADITKDTKDVLNKFDSLAITDSQNHLQFRCTNPKSIINPTKVEVFMAKNDTGTNANFKCHHYQNLGYPNKCQGVIQPSCPCWMGHRTVAACCKCNRIKTAATETLTETGPDRVTETGTEKNTTLIDKEVEVDVECNNMKLQKLVVQTMPGISIDSCVEKSLCEDQKESDEGPTQEMVYNQTTTELPVDINPFNNNSGCFPRRKSKSIKVSEKKEIEKIFAKEDAPDCCKSQQTKTLTVDRANSPVILETYTESYSTVEKPIVDRISVVSVSSKRISKQPSTILKQKQSNIFNSTHNILDGEGTQTEISQRKVYISDYVQENECIPTITCDSCQKFEMDRKKRDSGCCSYTTKIKRDPVSKKWYRRKHCRNQGCCVRRSRDFSCPNNNCRHDDSRECYQTNDLSSEPTSSVKEEVVRHKKNKVPETPEVNGCCHCCKRKKKMCKNENCTSDKCRIKLIQTTDTHQYEIVKGASNPHISNEVTKAIEARASRISENKVCTVPETGRYSELYQCHTVPLRVNFSKQANIAQWPELSQNDTSSNKSWQSKTPALPVRFNKRSCIKVAHCAIDNNPLFPNLNSEFSDLKSLDTITIPEPLDEFMVVRDVSTQVELKDSKDPKLSCIQPPIIHNSEKPIQKKLPEATTVDFSDDFLKTIPQHQEAPDIETIMPYRQEYTEKLQEDRMKKKKMKSFSKKKHFFDWKIMRKKKIKTPIKKDSNYKIKDTVDQILSEGEAECNCSISIGEIHACKTNINDQKMTSKNENEEQIHVAATNRRYFNKNIVSYYISRSSNDSTTN